MLENYAQFGPPQPAQQIFRLRNGLTSVAQCEKNSVRQAIFFWYLTSYLFLVSQKSLLALAIKTSFLAANDWKSTPPIACNNFLHHIETGHKIIWYNWISRWQVLRSGCWLVDLISHLSVKAMAISSFRHRTGILSVGDGHFCIQIRNRWVIGRLYEVDV